MTLSLTITVVVLTADNNFSFKVAILFLIFSKVLRLVYFALSLYYHQSQDHVVKHLKHSNKNSVWVILCPYRNQINGALKEVQLKKIQNLMPP